MMGPNQMTLVGWVLYSKGFHCMKSRFGLTTLAKHFPRPISDLSFEAVFEHGGNLPSSAWRNWVSYTSREIFAATMLAIDLPGNGVQGSLENYCAGLFPADTEFKGLGLLAGNGLDIVVRHIESVRTACDRRVIVEKDKAKMVIAPIISKMHPADISRFVGYLVNYAYERAAAYTAFQQAFTGRPDESGMDLFSRIEHSGFRKIRHTAGESARYEHLIGNGQNFTVNIYDAGNSAYKIRFCLPGLGGETEDWQRHYYAADVLPGVAELVPVGPLNVYELSEAAGPSGRRNKAPGVIEKTFEFSFGIKHSAAQAVIPEVIKYAHLRASAYSQAFSALAGLRVE